METRTRKNFPRKLHGFIVLCCVYTCASLRQRTGQARTYSSVVRLASHILHPKHGSSIDSDFCPIPLNEPTFFFGVFRSWRLLPTQCHPSLGLICIACYLPCFGDKIVTFLQDQKEGRGTMIWVARRERYTGNWKADLQSGYGEHVWIEDRCDAVAWYVILRGTIVKSTKSC